MVTLSSGDQRRLLALARRALEARVRGDRPPEIERGGGLDLHLGAFVTIHRANELRGCLGRLDRDRPIAEHVVHLAAIVSDSDPRFPPVRAAELPLIAIQISALTAEQEVADIEAIEVGRHGLIVEHGRRRGLLLPQVAIEYDWDRITFLAHTCLKAGLPSDAWRNGARIFCFEAQVFGEDDLQFQG